MKKIYLIVFILLSLGKVSAQQPCIDAIITTNNDTIKGMLIATTDTSYTIDNFNLVIALHKDMVKEHIPCYREVTRTDLSRMKNLDYLTEMDLYKNTPGFYLRKASRSFYLGLTMEVAGGLAMGMAFVNDNPNKTTQKWAVFSGGTVIFAGGLFFLLRSFYLVDKAGKLLDLERSAIYLAPTKDGRIELRWSF